MKRKPIKVGKILLEEYLKPMGISQYRLARDIKVPVTRINAIIHGKRSLTVDTATRLSLYFKTSLDFWLNLQKECDLREFRQNQLAKVIKEIHPFEGFGFALA